MGMSLLEVSGGGLWGDFRGKAQVEDSGFKSQVMVSRHGLRVRPYGKISGGRL